MYPFGEMKNIEQMSRASIVLLLSWLKTLTGLHRMQGLQVQTQRRV